MNFNDVITINGYKITVTPQPGMVVAYRDCWWRVEGHARYSDEEPMPDCLRLGRPDMDGPNSLWVITDVDTANTTPVLLAPSDLYSAWDALACYYELEAGGIVVFQPSDTGEWELPKYELHNYDGEITSATFAAVTRDMQKYGVLLDWCKLWEAK